MKDVTSFEEDGIDWDNGGFANRFSNGSEAQLQFAQSNLRDMALVSGRALPHSRKRQY